MNIQSIQIAIKANRPKAAYLGRLEMNSMLEAANAAGFDTSMNTAEPDLHRLEYEGCQLFQVDSESHFSMSSEGMIGKVPEHILALAERLNTQDNRATADPMFCVQEKHRIYGIDTSHRDPDGYIYTDDSGEECDIKHSTQKLPYINEWRTVMTALTEQGCKDYIRANGHNIKEPRIYSESFRRCEEMIELRKWLMTLAAAKGALK